MKFKFQWINKIVEKLPEELKEKRKAEIGSCFIGTKKQLDEKVRKSLYEQVKIISVATIIFLIVLFLTIIFYFSQDRMEVAELLLNLRQQLQLRMVWQQLLSYGAVQTMIT